jgi:hypothetical protein
MKLILFLLVMIAVASVVVARRRREQARAERAKALRAERAKRRRERIPNVSANLRGSTGPEPIASTPGGIIDYQAARIGGR